MIEDRRQRVRAIGKEPVTINRELQRLHAAIGNAVEWKIIDRHPFAGVKPLRHDWTGIVRYLSTAEEARLREEFLRREEKLRKERGILISGCALAAGRSFRKKPRPTVIICSRWCWLR